MNNVIFKKILKPAGQTHEGEFPIAIEVTEENNGYCVFLCGHPDRGTVLLRHDMYQKMELIEWAVMEAKNDETVMEALSGPQNIIA